MDTAAVPPWSPMPGPTAPVPLHPLQICVAANLARADQPLIIAPANTALAAWNTIEPRAHSLREESPAGDVAAQVQQPPVSNFLARMQPSIAALLKQHQEQQELLLPLLQQREQKEVLLQQQQQGEAAIITIKQWYRSGFVV